jgi:hypothetical protein
MTAQAHQRRGIVRLPQFNPIFGGNTRSGENANRFDSVARHRCRPRLSWWREGRAGSAAPDPAGAV